MEQPEIAARKPARLELQPGTYYWCRCGRSRTQPFCDGSHQGTSFEPLELVIEQPRRVSLCQCKRTQAPPMCDGAHKRLP